MRTMLRFSWILLAAAAFAADTFDQQAAVAELRKKIAGKESLPAEQVFSNIQKMKGVPAQRLLGVMAIGYAKSLGVTCTHCHNPEDWSSDEKTPKKIAREMSDMSRTLNEQLRGIALLKDRTPPVTVNCTTCHRGATKPALNLP
ncbi:MAG: c-type cytochrome [Bryobacteraceae bacterium]|nr:c-type cytochrome [Bryobacteraceae bacterium]